MMRRCQPDGDLGVPRVRVSGYDELKLRIEPAAGGGYRVLATGPAGEASANFALPFQPMEIENFVLRVGRTRGRRKVDTASSDAAKQFGGQLFDAVVQGQVRDLYRAATSRSRNEDRGLRMTLCLSETPELMDLPWEYLYDDPNFLATSAFTPVVRYLDLPSAPRPFSVTLPLRILGVISSPSDYEPLDVDRERTNLEQALGGLLERGIVEIEWLERPSLSSLLRRLQSTEFHILHFVGHGSFDEQAGQGVLLFQDENGYGQQVTGDSLGMLLRDFTSLRLVVLNACEGARTSRADPFAGVATALVERDVPAVIAMQFEITDRSAIAFAEGFYHALASGSPVDQALSAARLGIFANASRDIEWGTPVLFMRVGDGRIFELPDAPVAAPAPVVIATEQIPAPVVAPVPVAATAPPPPPATRSPTPVADAAAVTAETRGPRPPALWLAGAAAVIAVIVVVVILLSGGSHHRNGAEAENAPISSTTPVLSATTSSVATGSAPTQTRTQTQTRRPAGPRTISVDTSQTVAPLTLRVTRVTRTGTTVILALTASVDQSTGLSIDFLQGFNATDGTSDALTTPQATSWSLNAGESVPETLELDGVSAGAKTVSISIGHFEYTNVNGMRSEPDLYQSGITVSDIPLPAA